VNENARDFRFRVTAQRKGSIRGCKGSGVKWDAKHAKEQRAQRKESIRGRKGRGGAPMKQKEFGE